MADPYHGLAHDYDWIFDDDALTGGAAINRPATTRLLRRIGPASHVLDTACGTGIDAAVLARRGFTVRAARWCTPPGARRWSSPSSGCGGWHVPEDTW